MNKIITADEKKTRRNAADGDPDGVLAAKKREYGTNPSFANSRTTRDIENDAVIKLPNDDNAASVAVNQSIVFPNTLPINNATTVTPVLLISSGVATIK